MSENQKSAFEVINWGKWRVVVVQSDRIDESLAYGRKSGADGLLISPHNGFASDDLSFLVDVKDQNIGIVLPYAQRFDISILQKLTRLRFLTLADSKQPIDLSVFSQLEDLRIRMAPQLETSFRRTKFTAKPLHRLLQRPNPRPTQPACLPKSCKS